MKTLKVSNYQQALKEINALDSTKAGIIKEEINFDDRNHYHVAMVRITDRPGQAKNDVSVNVQMFHESGFQKLEKNFQILGFNKLIVVHDPNQNPVEETQTAPQTTPPATTKTPEEIEAEIEAKANAKADELFNARLAKMEAEKGTEGQGTPPATTDEAVKFGETIAEMKSFAELNKIDLSGLKKSEDIKTAIETWLAEQKN